MRSTRYPDCPECMVRAEHRRLATVDGRVPARKPGFGHDQVRRTRRRHPDAQDVVGAGEDVGPVVGRRITALLDRLASGEEHLAPEIERAGADQSDGVGVVHAARATDEEGSRQCPRPFEDTGIGVVVDHAEIGPADSNQWTKQVPLLFDGNSYIGSTKFTAPGAFDARILGRRPDQAEASELYRRPSPLVAARPHFDALRQLRDEHGGAQRLPELSMGMTHDLEHAVAAGATLVRVGTAIFGARPGH